MIYTDTASEVAQNVAKDLTVPPPQPPVAATEPMGRYAEDQFSAPAPSTPAYIPPPAYIPQPQVMGRYGEDQYAPQPPTPMPQGVGPSSLAQLQQMAGIGPAFLARITNALPAIDLYNSISNANPGATPDQINRVIQYAQQSNNPQGNIQGFLNPKEDIGYEQFANMTNAPFAAAQKAIESVPVTPYGTPLGSEINRLPAPLATAGHLATGAALPVAADIATGGALTPAYMGQAAIQASAIGDQYKAGKLSGDDALKALAMTAGPFVLPILLRAATAGGRALLDYAQSDQGQAVLSRLNEERGGVGTPPEPPQEPPAEARAGEVGAPAPAQPPPSPEQARLASTQGALEGMQPENTAAPTAREQGVSRAAAGLENISRSPQEVADAAIGFGASAQDAHTLARSLQNAESITSKPDELLNAGKTKQRIAGTLAGIQGKLPGQVGKVAEVDIRLRNYLDVSMEHAMPLIRKADQLISRDLGKIDNNTKASVYEHPDEFTGLKPDTLKAIQDAAAAGPKYPLLRATDPTSARGVSGNYLAQIYQGEDASPLAAPVHNQRGETGVAESRRYPDRRVAIAAGETMKDMTLPELYAASYRRTNQAIQDAVFRKNVLQNFATTDKAVADANGWQAVKNPVFTRPEEGPFYAPQAVRNMIDQRYKPAGGAMQTAARLSGKGKSLMMIPGDTGGIINRLKTLVPQKPESILTGMLKDILTGTDQAQQAQWAADGLKGARGGSLAAESSVTPGASIYSRITGAPWQAIGKLSEWAHEGNILIGEALGADMNPATEAGMRNRQASADEVNMVRLASRGAQVESRNTAERVALLSQQTTRALFSRVNQIGQLLSPSSTPYQRFLAAQGLMHWAVATWGVASVARMAFGDGKPAPFPVSWDGKHFKYNSDWYMAKVGNYSIPTTADLGLANALIKSATIVADAAANPSASGAADVVGEAVKPLAQFGVGRLGPLTRPIPSAFRVGYTPEGRFSTHMTAGQSIAAALPQPISISRIMENPNVLTDPKAFAQEQLLGGFPPSPNQPFFSARDLMNQTNFPSADLTSAQQKSLSGLGVSGSNLTEMRAAFADKWTQYYTTHDVHGRPLANPVSPLEAKRIAVSKFDAYSGVKSVRQEQQKAEHQWAHDNPYALLQAVEAGNITPDAYEKTVVEWARAHPQ